MPKFILEVGKRDRGVTKCADPFSLFNSLDLLIHPLIYKGIAHLQRRVEIGLQKVPGGPSGAFNF